MILDEVTSAQREEINIEQLEKKVQTIEDHLTQKLGSRSPGLDTFKMGVAMSDRELDTQTDYHKEQQDEVGLDTKERQLLARIADIEDRLPKNTEEDVFDVPIPFLTATATTSEIIECVNTLIQRTQRIN